MFDVKPITSPIEQDCGATCMAMLLDYYGDPVTVADMNKECNIKINGTSAKDLMNVGRKHGLDMRCFKMDTEELSKQDRPAIVWWKYSHFCMFCGMDEAGKIVVCNPDKGLYRMSKGLFNAFYSGIAIFNGEPHDIDDNGGTEDEHDRLENQAVEP